MPRTCIQILITEVGSGLCVPKRSGHGSDPPNPGVQKHGEIAAAACSTPRQSEAGGQGVTQPGNIYRLQKTPRKQRTLYCCLAKNKVSCFLTESPGALN